MYVYNMMTGNRFQGVRDNNREFMVGAIGSLLVDYAQNPLMSLFAGIKSY
jgi:hypothetical protein